MNTEHLRPGLAEPNFRRFESVIAAAMAVYPSEYRIPPRANYSQETISCRLRDAIRSLALNQWPCSINMSLFNEVAPTLEVARDGDDVVIRRRRPRGGSRAQPHASDMVVTLDKPSPDLLHAAMVLCHYRALPGYVRVSGLTLADVRDAIGDLDVGATEQGSCVILI